jgi:hypothetical protein
MVTALLLAAALAQGEPPNGEAPPPKALVDDTTPPPTSKPAPDPLYQRPNDGTNPNTPQAVHKQAATIEEVNRQLERIKRLQPADLSQQVDQFRKLGQQPTPAPLPNPNQVPEQPQPYGLLLSDPDQVKALAHSFFDDVIAGDARSIVLHSGYPFYLEDRRLELPDELHDEWLKNLRSKRTDLLTLYDIEVLTPQEMEKKYGKPPARLKNLPWNTGAKTFIAVGNLSGHACIAVYREAQIPHHWQIVGYTD